MLTRKQSKVFSMFPSVCITSVHREPVKWPAPGSFGTLVEHAWRAGSRAELVEAERWKVAGIRVARRIWVRSGGAKVERAKCDVSIFNHMCSSSSTELGACSLLPDSNKP